MDQEKNIHFKRAFIKACKDENISPTAWCTSHGLPSNIMSRLRKYNLSRDLLAVFADKDNWKNKSNASAAMVGAIFDIIQDAGRNPAEFSVKASENHANAALENNIRVIEEFAGASPDFVSLIAEMAAMIQSAKLKKKRK